MNHDEAHALIEGLVRDEVAWEPEASAEGITEAVIAELREMHSTGSLPDDDVFTVLGFLVLRAVSTPTTPLELFFSAET
jgi:hypothetical protein